MNYLAFDTSSHYLSVVAKKGEKTASEFLPDCSMQHSVVLMGIIDKCLNMVGMTPNECDFFTAIVGPGSFTGIRIGIATAKGFALATNKKLKSITSFDMLAYNINAVDFVVAIDAAHGYFYVRGYGAFAFEPKYMSRDELLFLGAEIYAFEKLDIPDCKIVDLKNALQVASEKHSRLSDEMYAVYVRKSQAEEAYDRKRVEV